VARVPDVLGERDYRLLFGAQAVSLLGDQMVPVALAFGVLARGGGASAVGLVFAARSAALILCLLGGGVLGDRLPRRALLVATDLLRLCSQGAIAAVLIAGGTAIWPIVALSAVTGAGVGVFNPTATGFLPEVVPPQWLQEANALRGLASSVGRIAGPLLAGLLVATVGAGWALAVDAATYAVSAALVVRIRTPGSGRAAGAPAETFLAELRAGWDAFRSRTWLVTIVASSAIGNVVFGAWRVLGPVLAEDHLGGVGAWSAIAATSGAGGVVGGLLGLRLAPRRPLVFQTFAVAVFFSQMILLAALAPTPAIAAAAFVGEIGLVLGWTVWESTLQRHVEPHLLSRVSAYDWLGSFVFEPLGLVLWGPIAVLTGATEALWIAVTVGVVTTFAVLAVPAVRTLPTAPEAVAPTPGA
jgi:predicted MFS family arabinose efflux permease